MFELTIELMVTSIRKFIKQIKIGIWFPNGYADVAEWSFLIREHNNASALSPKVESKPIRFRASRSSNLLICVHLKVSFLCRILYNFVLWRIFTRLLKNSSFFNYNLASNMNSPLYKVQSCGIALL